MDLPEPEGPRTTTFSPAFNSKSTPFKTWFLPKDFLSCFTEITFSESFLDAINNEADEIDDGEIEKSGGEHGDNIAGHVLAATDVFGGHI